MHTVVGLFDHFGDADRAVHALEEYSVDARRINIITQDNDKLPHHSNAAGVGAATGATAGGLIGLLAGLGALAIPGIGPVIATGALATTLGSTLGMTAIGAGVGAAAGGLVGALVHHGFSKEDAEFYAEGVKRGGVLVYVDADSSNEDRVKSILKDAGAINVDERRKTWQDEGWTSYDKSTEADEYNQNNWPHNSNNNRTD